MIRRGMSNAPVRRIVPAVLSALSIIIVLVLPTWQRLTTGLSGLVPVGTLEALCDDALKVAWQGKATLTSTFYTYNNRYGRPARAKTAYVRATVQRGNARVSFAYYDCERVDAADPPRVTLRHHATTSGP